MQTLGGALQGEANLGSGAALTSWVVLAHLKVNTPAAEVLYTVIQDWAQLDMESTVLDVCCGTGTIGLALARVSPPTHLS